MGSVNYYSRGGDLVIFDELFNQRKLLYDFRDKPNARNLHLMYMFNRTQSMFRYSGLPDTIPQRILELYLQFNGHCVFYEYNNNLYIFTGGLGGKPDVYYQPTIYTIANPALNISRNLEIDTDCVLIKNDSNYLGLYPLFNRYATLLVENELSILLAQINTRIISHISANDDTTAKSAEKYLCDIEAGKQGVISEESLMQSLRVSTNGQGNNQSIQNLIELEQYLKAGWYNDIGLNANYNMKRESLNSNESQLNDDMLLPLIDDMINTRHESLEKVNQKYGLNITVDFSSSWKDNQIEIENAQEMNGGETDGDKATTGGDIES